MTKVGFVYKIARKDGVDADMCYIGSTMNLQRRKQCHRANCKKNPDRLLYRYISENGGFENFDLYILEKVVFEDKFELTGRERHWIESLTAPLNAYAPAKTPTVCEHGKGGYWCKECGGAGICEHSRRRHHCKECGGAGICEHDRRRTQCKECGGAGICEHGRHRFSCMDCNPEKYAENLRKRREKRAQKKKTE